MNYIYLHNIMFTTYSQGRLGPGGWLGGAGVDRGEGVVGIG